MIKLKDLRQGRGLTQQDIAEILDVQFSAVSKLELGKTTINNQKLKKLITALELNADEVLELLDIKEIIKK